MSSAFADNTAVIHTRPMEMRALGGGGESAPHYSHVSVVLLRNSGGEIILLLCRLEMPRPTPLSHCMRM